MAPTPGALEKLALRAGPGQAEAPRFALLWYDDADAPGGFGAIVDGEERSDMGFIDADWQPQ